MSNVDAQMFVEKPEDIRLTLALTMSLKQWIELKSQLQEKWPAWELGNAIRDMTEKATKHFYPNPPP